MVSERFPGRRRRRLGRTIAVAASLLVFAGVTDTCAMGMLIAKLPYNRPASCDVPSMVRALTSGATPSATRSAAAADVACCASAARVTT